MNLKIGFNISPLKNANKNRGIGNYTKHLLEELKRSKEVEIYEFDKESEVRDVNLVHYPFFDLFRKTLPQKSRYKTVVTIHDLIPEIFSDHYPVGLRGMVNNFFQRRALKNVDCIITDSKSSAEDIKKILKVKPSIINTIPLAPSGKFKLVRNKKLFQEIQQRFQLPNKFIIYVGDVNWNKNLKSCAQACLDNEIDLVMVGAAFQNQFDLNHPEMKSFKEFLNEFGNNPKIHILGYLNDHDLVTIMNEALALILVSFYEGFGLPILEAMACGVPVITSNTSSMPEVGGNAALYVDPYDISNISQGVKEITKNKGKRDDLIRRGFENVKKYSWEITAQKTIEVYKKMV